MSTEYPHRPLRMFLTGTCLVAVALWTWAVAPAAETPRRGGVLLAAVAADAPSLDPHQESTFATIQPTAPLYSTLLQIDPYNYPNVVGDLATEWNIAPDGLTYTFKLRRGVRFHDGSPLTAADVKASYDKILWPPQPKKHLDRDPNYFKNHAIGSGPFKFKSYTRGSTFEGERTTT